MILSSLESSSLDLQFFFFDPICLRSQRPSLTHLKFGLGGSKLTQLALSKYPTYLSFLIECSHLPPRTITTLIRSSFATGHCNKRAFSLFTFLLSSSPLPWLVGEHLLGGFSCLIQPGQSTSRHLLHNILCFHANPIVAAPSCSHSFFLDFYIVGNRWASWIDLQNFLPA